MLFLWFHSLCCFNSFLYSQAETEKREYIASWETFFACSSLFLSWFASRIRREMLNMFSRVDRRVCCPFNFFPVTRDWICYACLSWCLCFSRCFDEGFSFDDAFRPARIAFLRLSIEKRERERERERSPKVYPDLSLLSPSQLTSTTEYVTGNPLNAWLKTLKALLYLENRDFLLSFASNCPIDVSDVTQTSWSTSGLLKEITRFFSS
jgi:hypothetical protein